MSSVEVKMQASAAVFKETVWPFILKQGWVRPGELIPVETDRKESLARSLDIYSGIDAWQLDEGHSGIRGIASRVQWDTGRYSAYPFNTFTIRAETRCNETELQKRLRAWREADRGWLYPHLTCQAYMGREGAGIIRSVMVCKTDYLYGFVAWLQKTDRLDRGPFRYRRNPQDGNRFLPVPYDRIRGVRFWEREGHQ